MIFFASIISYLCLLAPLSTARALPLSSPIPSIHPAPKNRFFLSNLTSAYYTLEKPVSNQLLGPLAISAATPEDLRPYTHPRVVTGPSEWNSLLQKHVSNFDRDNSWSKALLRLTRKAGPDSPIVHHLAALETSAATAVFTGKPRRSMTPAEISALKPLADELRKSTEWSSHALFLCSFWASVSQRQEGEGFLGQNSMKICIHASVAWAKVLMAHRTYYCDPECKQAETDTARTYLWDTDRNWEVSQDWFTAGLSLALSYDVLYHEMDIVQREVVRSAIALLVMKRWTWGTITETTPSFPNAETHPHRIYGNWAMYHSNLYLTNLAIEGEAGFMPYVEYVLKENESTGFNKDMDRKFEAMISAFMTHTIYPDGSTFEDGYVYHTALREGALALIASHRRGSNVLAITRFRNTIHNAAQMFEPWHCSGLVGHASGGGLSYPTYVGLFRYVYPKGPLPRMLWAQRFGKNFTNTDACRIYWTQTMTQLTFLGDEHADSPENIADSPETLAEDMKHHFPLAYVSTRRGLIITRSSYSQRSSYMHFDARPDSFFLGHDNADRGVITFSALKRRWIDDLEWVKNIESRRHSLLHVDGVAQAEKAPSVTIMKSVNTKRYCITAADLSYTYNVQWAKAWQGPRIGTGSVVKYGKDGSSHIEVHTFSEAEDHSPWDLGWPMEDDAAEIGFNRSMSLNGYPDLAFAGMFQWKRNLREQALTHMIRSTIMMRSNRNEVGFGVLVDSVGTQSDLHDFESYLILQADVSVDEKMSKCCENNCKITLQSTGTEQLDLHVRTMGNLLSYRVEQFDGNKRLIVKSSSQREEQFWIAFHPHEGNPEGFEMTRGSNGVIEFLYHGEHTLFSVSKDDYSVIETDAVGNARPAG